MVLGDNWRQNILKATNAEARYMEEDFINSLCLHWNLRRPGGIHSLNRELGQRVDVNFLGNQTTEHQGHSLVLEPSAADSNWALRYQAGQVQFVVDNQSLAELWCGRAQMDSDDAILKSHFTTSTNLIYKLIGTGTIIPRRATGDLVKWVPRAMNTGADPWTHLVREIGPKLFFDAELWRHWQSHKVAGAPWAMQIYSDGGHDITSCS